jgi:protein gp37
MAKSNIAWTDYVWNPVTGCTQISAGCQNCYAKRMAETRLRGQCGYPADEPFRVTLHPERLSQPLNWKKARIVFLCSMGDLFHPDVPFEYVTKIFKSMFAYIFDGSLTRHTYIWLTKRPERMREYLLNHAHVPALSHQSFEQWKPPNLWLGVTAENQAAAEKRIPILIDIPAAKRFVSVEPMLSKVYLNEPYKFDRTRSPYHSLMIDRLDWVICGGENAPNARPMNPDWVRSLRDQCQAAEVPFFFKSWGEYMPFDFSYGKWCRWKNKKDPARYQLDGKSYREWPE